MEHREAKELLEAYAIGALDPDEQNALEEHIKAGCPECDETLKDLEELTSRLALSVSQKNVSPSVKEGLMAKVKNNQPEPKNTLGKSVFVGWIAAGIAAGLVFYLGIRTTTLNQKVREKHQKLTTANEEISRLSKELHDVRAEHSNAERDLEKAEIEISQLRESLAIMEKKVLYLENDITTAETEITNLRKDLAETEDITGLIRSPGTQFINLSGVDPNPQAFGKVILDPIQGSAVVYMYRLPEPPDCMEYQLWVIREGKPTSAGVFKVGKDGHTVLKLKEFHDPESIASFSVTLEDGGGQPAPTGMLYLIGP